MPKIVDKAQMRQAILSASLKAFLIDGIHKTTMDKIAKKAGIAKGTLYLYFKSKEELIETITKQYFEKLKSKLIPQQFFDTPDSLLEHIKKSLCINEDESQYIAVIIEVFGASFSSSVLREKHSLFLMEVSNFYEKNLQALRDNKLINKDINPKNFSRLLISLMDGIIFHQYLFQTENSNQQQMINDVIDLFECGLSLPRSGCK
ncbi:MAG: TetR/AcrR family transcriptional regulator [Methylococcales bacterium]|nr:TetR/AcrR family transcriptional regulator [Methylococcales bacterium]